MPGELKSPFEQQMGSWAGLCVALASHPRNGYAAGLCVALAGPPRNGCAAGDCSRCGGSPRQAKKGGAYHSYCTSCRQLYNREYKAKKAADKLAPRRKENVK